MAKLTEEQRAQRAAARARREAFAAEEEDRLENERREKWRREGTRLSWEEAGLVWPVEAAESPCTTGWEIGRGSCI